MKIPLLLILSLLLIPNSWSKTSRPISFRAQVNAAPKFALSGMDDLLKRLRESADTKEKLDLLQKIDEWTRPLDRTGEFSLVIALEAIVDSPVEHMGVRSRAAISLGKVAVRSRHDDVLTRLARFLAETAAVSHPHESRNGLRIPALRALSMVAKYLPDHDDQTAEQVLGVALDAASRGSGQEKLAGIMVFDNFLRGHGGAALYRLRGMSSRIESEVIAPLEAGLERLFSNPDTGRDYRYFLIRGLAYLSWPGTQDGSTLPHRARQILEKISKRDPDADLRRLAAFYAGRAPRRLLLEY